MLVFHLHSLGMEMQTLVPWNDCLMKMESYVSIDVWCLVGMGNLMWQSVVTMSLMSTYSSSLSPNYSSPAMGPLWHNCGMCLFNGASLKSELDPLYVKVGINSVQCVLECIKPIAIVLYM